MNEKNNVKRISSYQIYEIADELLIDGSDSIIITVIGNSMYPFLRSKADSVELCKVEYEDIKINDIIFAKKDNRCVLHRLYKKYPDSFVMLGDGNLKADKIYSKDDFLLKARAIYRKDKRIECSSVRFRILSSVWKIMKPFRKQIFRAYYKIRYKK